MDWTGRVLKISEIDDRLYFFLRCLFDEGSKFSIEIISHKDICKRFSIFQSLRQVLDTRVLEIKVSEVDIDVVNHWKVVDMAKRSRLG